MGEGLRRDDQSLLMAGPFRLGLCARRGSFGRSFFAMRMGEAAQEITYMAEALGLARNAFGRTSPNPMVGAVVVREGRVVGRGFHPRAGEPHAEIFALREAGQLAHGATMHVSLEPCCHWGRTGPCTEALIDAGIACVVVATEDPDPRVNGAGIRVLREQGIEVIVGVLREQAEALNAAYFKHRRAGLPLVTLKWAISLDGKIASGPGTRTPLTAEAASRYGHELRNAHDAILVGINTILVDDSQLTCRIEGGRDPLRVILDSRLRLPLDARVLNLSSPAQTLVVTTPAAAQEKLEAIRATGADILVFDGARPPVRWVLEKLAGRGLLSVLVEGGATVHASFITAGLADRVVVFVASRIIGNQLAPSAVAGGGGGAPGGEGGGGQGAGWQIWGQVVVEGAHSPFTPRQGRLFHPAGTRHLFNMVT